MNKGEELLKANRYYCKQGGHFKNSKPGKSRKLVRSDKFRVLILNEGILKNI